MNPANFVKLERVDGVAVATLLGEIDMARAGPVRDTLSAAVGNEEFGLVVDLTEALYLDSAGVNVLFELAEWMRGRQQQLVAVAPENSLIQDVLKIVNLGEVVPLYQDRRGAVDHLREAALPPGGGEEPAA